MNDILARFIYVLGSEVRHFTCVVRQCYLWDVTCFTCVVRQCYLWDVTCFTCVVRYFGRGGMFYLCGETVLPVGCDMIYLCGKIVWERWCVLPVW